MPENYDMIPHDPADDDGPDEDFEPGDDCGRWIDGRLGSSCMLAGTEFCDFECPHRG